VSVINSTISGNSAESGGGGLGNHNDNGTVTLLQTTVTNNTADSDENDHGDGGGIHNAGGTVTLTNTIVAGNTDGSAGPDPIHPDISGDITGNSYNLIGDTTGGMGSAGMYSDMASTDPLLGPLADNGGSTETHALLGGSPAINYVPSSECILPVDQRGISRPQGSDCDIGAYERVCRPVSPYLLLLLNDS
jgi:hypothetical protein